LGYKQTWQFCSWGLEVSVVVRSTAKNPNGRQKKSAGEAVVKPAADDAPATEAPDGVAAETESEAPRPRKNGGWREIEARREKAALKASLADVWDEDFDLDEETLADLDHTAEFFTSQEEPEEEVFDDDDEEVDEYFDDDEV
jgi:hypothetical protein